MSPTGLEVGKVKLGLGFGNRRRPCRPCAGVKQNVNLGLSGNRRPCAGVKLLKPVGAIMSSGFVEHEEVGGLLVSASGGETQAKARKEIACDAQQLIVGLWFANHDRDVALAAEDGDGVAHCNDWSCSLVEKFELGSERGRESPKETWEGIAGAVCSRVTAEFCARL